MSIDKPIAKYYANGKLLLTGEYLILFGAKSLAFPLKYGQTLEIYNALPGELNWIAYSEDANWFNVRFQLPEMHIIETSSMDRAISLREILNETYKLNSSFIDISKGYRIITRTNYPIEWGLGSSSTLIYNLALWAKINPFKLHRNISFGSGYDIACASENKPISYKLTKNNSKIIEKIFFKKDFLTNMHCIYSGEKKNTERSLKDFLIRHKGLQKEVKQVSKITEKIIAVDNINQFMQLLSNHERIISNVLNVQPIKEMYYPDFNGALKSLGAWGGDMFLAVTAEPEAYVKNYFEQFKLSSILSFEKIILT